MAKIKLRRDTAANWQSANPVLALGEPGYDTTNNKIKVGNGTSTWAQLSYLTGSSSVSADLDNIKIQGSTIGTTDSPDTGNWGDYNLYLDPGGESNAYISIPGVPAQSEGTALQIYNKGNETSIVQVFGQGGVQITTNTNTSEKIFEFRDDGSLQLPANGDIVDSTGNSVLGAGGSISVLDQSDNEINNVNAIAFVGAAVTNPEPGLVTVTVEGGTPTIPDTRRGFINLVGDRPNDNDDAWFESVVVRGDYAYVIGGDYYISNLESNSYEPKVYKFDLRTGEQVWVKQITAGRGAEFIITIADGVVTLDSINNGGTNYAQGEELVIQGWQIQGSYPQNNFIIIADTVDQSGAILTASVKPGYDVGAASISGQQLQPASSGATSSEGLTIGYDDFNNMLIVSCQYNPQQGDSIDFEWQWSNLFVIDPVTGQILQALTLSDDGDVYVNSIRTRNALGNVAVVGEKYGEYNNFGNLTILSGNVGYFDILKSNLNSEHYPGSTVPGNWYSDFYITGTGIVNKEFVDGVNYYTQLPSTVRQGSGAVFSITIGGTGPYTYDAVTVTTPGINYRVGHKILIVGTDLEGLSPSNDLVIQVDDILPGSGGIGNVSIVSGTYGNAQAAPYTYTGKSGTGTQMGSGATFYSNYNYQTGITTFNIDAVGSGYVVDDIIIIPGTNFANGTSPANDVEVEVNNIDGIGGASSITVISDDIPTDALRIRVDNVDFSSGTWAMTQLLGGEAFVWTPTWSKAIGGPSGDRYYDAAWSSNGQYLYAVGRGRYETEYDQALVVKYAAADGAIVWSKDIRFAEAATNNRQASSVIEIPGSTDILVAGSWYNNSSGAQEVILTRMTAAGAAVWQKTYVPEFDGQRFYTSAEINLKASEGGIVVSFNQNTNDNNGMAFMVVNVTNGTVTRHRVLSSDGNSNYGYYDTPTPNFADLYIDDEGSHIVVAGYTYVPTDNYYNALLYRLPLDGYKNIDVNQKLSLGEHILNRHNVEVTTVTPAFDDFVATEHPDTITTLVNARNYVTRDPDGLLQVWTYTITNDAAGYLEFGDGSKQSFATNLIPQIPAANDYYLTTQDSGKHIFFENENGRVRIPHREQTHFPVGFTFTIVNTTGSDCYVTAQTGEALRARLKLAGRNIDTYTIGIPDSGSGSMVTLLKIKDGYTMANSDGNGDYPDVWMVSGPGDVYDND